MKSISQDERRKLARELIIGAPIAGLVWLLIWRGFFGVWSISFPLVIAGISLVMALLMLGPDPVASGACRVWKALVRTIDWIVTRIVCLALYYLIFTPMGLFLRMLSVPLLRLRKNHLPDTFWQKVSPPTDKRQHYFRQY
jgi:hypothetical protein